MRLDAISIGRMETLLSQWGRELDALVLMDQATGLSAESAHHKRIEEVRAQCESARTRLAEIRAAGSFRWSVFEKGMAGAWRLLESAYRRLVREAPT